MARPLKIEIELDPTPRGVALAHLVYEVREGGWRFGRTLRREVLEEFRAWNKTLTVLGESVTWLERQHVAYVERGRSRGATSLPVFASPIYLTADIREIADRVAAGNHASERWQLIAFTLRSVLIDAERGVWIEVKAAKLNTRHQTIEAVRALLDETMASVGCQFDPVSRRDTGRREQTPSVRTEARSSDAAPRESDEAEETPPATNTRKRSARNQTERVAQTEHEVPRTERTERTERFAQPAARSARSAPVRNEPPPPPVASATVPPAPVTPAKEAAWEEAVNTASPAQKAPRKKRTRAAASAEGFGGLPDDAESRPKAAESAPMGPRGVTVDAEFFLEQAGVTRWPCSRQELDVGRRAALSRLHPDRVGDHATQLFHRAVRGYTELCRWVEDHPVLTPAAPIGEWPPRPASGTGH